MMFTVWIAASIAATALGTITLYHPRVLDAQRIWFWWVSAFVLAMATSVTALILMNSLQVTLGVNLVIFLFYLVSTLIQIGRPFSIKKDVNTYSSTTADVKGWAFTCLLGALVTSALIVGIPYHAIGLAVIIALILPFGVVLLM
jgi:hypothetical protein